MGFKVFVESVPAQLAAICTQFCSGYSAMNFFTEAFQNRGLVLSLLTTRSGRKWIRNVSPLYQFFHVLFQRVV